MADSDTQVDEFLRSVGDDGRYQKILFWGFLVPISILIPWTVLVPIFQASVPNHWCHVPGKPDNTSLEEWKNITIPWIVEDEKWTLSKCKQYNFDEDFIDYQNNTDIIDCQNGWDFETTWFDSTLSKDEEWVCAQDSFSARWLSAGVAGNVIGTVFFNGLSDHFGRKPAIILLNIFFAIFGIVKLYVTSEYGILVLMFLSSMVFPANLEICLIFVMEQVSGKLRARITSVSFIMWTMGMCFVPLLAWLTRDWILLGIVSSVPFIPFVFVLWAFPESPRWLLSKGRSKAAFKAFQRIAKSNRKECPPELRSDIEALTKEIKSRKKSNNLLFVDLFRYPVVRKRLLLLSLCYVCNNSMYYGIIYNTSKISGNEFLNFFYLSISELPGNLLGWFCSQKFGRRFTQTGFFILGTFTALLAILLSYIDPWVEVLLAVICKTLINISFLVVYIQLAELLPTSHRSAGTGMASIISSVIAISSPYIAYSGTYWSTLPYVILMAIGSVGIVASLFLPETLGATLPQTLLDAEKFLVDQPFFSYLGWRPGGKKKKIQPVKV
ncbi:UNVERIFIED_CONTAM: hypothetical protein RMT77_009251 [Armadillidium vulgare]